MAKWTSVIDVNEDEAVRQVEEADYARSDAWALLHAEQIKTDSARLERALEYVDNCRRIIRKALRKADDNG